MHYDAIVIGVGGMGSATCFHLARRGLRVLGLERFGLAHDRGSSHGITRIIRLAYAEHPSYVPLLRRAYELWRELESLANERLLFVTGGLDIGRRDGPIVSGSLLSCTLHELPHELLDAGEIHSRFPGYRLPEDFVGVLQPDGGFVLSERCILAHAEAARAAGAAIHTHEAVVTWDVSTEQVRVRTDREEYAGRYLAITAGPWAAELAPVLAGLAVPERQVLMWAEPRRPELFTPARFPIFNMDADDGHYYGFPVYGVPGFKIGKYHHRGERVKPDSMDREVHPEDERILRAAIDRYFPDASGPTLMLETCLFTNSPDEHFILDHHPASRRVVIAAGFSGHGYKFCSVVGEIMADLLLEAGPRHDRSRFRLDRFGAG
jgi:sarcosine oxidase